MRFRAHLLVLAALTSQGCSSDPTAVHLNDADGCGFMSVCPDWGPGPTMRVNVEGEAWIGEYGALHDEVTLLVFHPTNLEVPLDSASSSWEGRFSFHLENVTRVEACAYQIKAIRWDGLELPLRPMAEDGAACFDSGRATTARFDFPAYEPLVEPLVVSGAVRIDGHPATAGAVSVRTRVRMPQAEWSHVEVPLSDQGSYRFETTNRAEWFALCHQPVTWVEAGDGAVVQAGLATVDRSRCHGTLPLPTARFGQIKAVWGWVLSATPATPVVGGGATVELLDPADGSRVGEAVSIEMDGRYSLWLPPEYDAPRCGLEIRIAYEGGATETRPLPGSASFCKEGPRLDFHVEGAS